MYSIYFNSSQWLPTVASDTLIWEVTSPVIIVATSEAGANFTTTIANTIGLVIRTITRDNVVTNGW